MKVETDIKSGNVIDDVANEAISFAGGINTWLVETSTDAQNLLDNTNRSVTSLWNCLSNAFSW